MLIVFFFLNTFTIISDADDRLELSATDLDTALLSARYTFMHRYFQIKKKKKKNRVNQVYILIRSRAPTEKRCILVHHV